MQNMQKNLARFGIAAMLAVPIAGLMPLIASAADAVSIVSADPSTVDPLFTPEIGFTLIRGTDAYIGRTSPYDGPALGADADTIFWKVTIDGPGGLTADMVDMDEVGFLDPPTPASSIGTYHYPFAPDGGDLVATGSCDTADLHDDLCAHVLGFSLDEDDVFTNADKINFESSAPIGHYAITYNLVDTTGDPVVLGTLTKEFDLVIPPTSSNVHIFKYVDGVLATSEGVG